MKKGFYWALSALLVLSLSACTEKTPSATEDSSAKQAFTAGTYTAEAEGIRSTVKLAVTFSENKIENIEILQQGETKNIADAAFEQIPQAIIENQSLAVDVVSSVTMTSRAVLNAVEEACVQAGGNLELLKTPLVQTQTQEEVNADVVVVGMGLAGITASMSALDAGGYRCCGGKSRRSGRIFQVFRRLYHRGGFPTAAGHRL